MNTDLYNQKGEKVGKIDLKDEIFNSEVNEKVVSQYVYSYLSNQRESNAHTKDRSEVRGGGKKPWKQKGTGKARFGSSRNPIWTGGGVAFGPTNAKNPKKSLTKKFKLAALRNVLSKLVSEKKLFVVDQISIDTKKALTKQGIKVVESLKSPKLLLVVDYNKDIVNAFNNIPNVKVANNDEVSAYDLITGGSVYIDQSTLNKIEAKFSK